LKLHNQFLRITIYLWLMTAQMIAQMKGNPMKDYDQILKQLEKQEQELQFDNFSNEMAWTIGTMLVEKARSIQAPVTIDIKRSGQQLFHYAFEGTTPDNDVWVTRKSNAVARFFHSSHYMHESLEKTNRTLEEAKLIPSSEYACHGGSFPIIIKKTGVIGSITVSGLASEDDHNMIIAVLSEYLGVEYDTPSYS